MDVPNVKYICTVVRSGHYTGDRERERERERERNGVKSCKNKVHEKLSRTRIYELQIPD